MLLEALIKFLSPLEMGSNIWKNNTFIVFIFLLEKVEDALTFSKVHNIVL